MPRSGSAAVALALVYVGAAATAAAQQLPPARFGLGAGLTMPRDEYHADATGAGFNAGWQGVIFLEFRKPRRPLGLRVDVVFGPNSGNDQRNAAATTSAGTPTTVKMRLLGANADVIYRLGLKAAGVGAYVLGGAGTYRVTLSSTSGSTTIDRSENKFGWNAGAGVTYPVGPGVAFVEARYFNLESALGVAKLPFVVVTAGVRMGST